MTLGRYRIVDKLGGGGMGEVYRAEDLSLHRHIAIKVLPPRLASRPDALDRFEREAAAVGALNHPNIVTIHSIEEVDGRRLITMELIQGRTLHNLVPDEGLTTEQCLDLAIPLTNAVAAAHQRGVTHRDLKPANIMVTEDNLVKVVDFGLAKLRQSFDDEAAQIPDATLTREGQVLGTVPYMAPEQFQALPADHRSDVFALGVVLYEMMTGRHPFPGDTQPLVISSILRDPPEPIENLRRDLPPALRTIVARCLEKAPNDRYQDAGELARDLIALKKQHDSDAILRLAGRGGRSGWRALVVGVALVVATLGGIWLLSRAGPGEPAVGRDTVTDGAAPTARVAPENSLPAIAVIHFFNTAGNDDLNWLRDGLADMFITDLSQSRALQVVAADRIYTVLGDLGALDGARRHDAELARAVATATGATVVVTGRFARLGDTIRIDVQLRDADSGEVLEAAAKEGQGEGSVFGLVDDLSQIVRVRVEGGAAAARPATDRSVETVTTASVKAYRLYLEGVNLHRSIKLDEAISLYEEAVELDPGYAMAYARLVAAHVARANFGAAKDYASLAFEHSERLPDRERGYIEGEYYSAQRATYPRAIAAFEETIRRFPDHYAARRSLGHLYGYVERLEDALAQYLPIFEQDEPLPGIANAIAHMEGLLDRFAAGYEVLQTEQARHPNDWVNYLTLGVHMTHWQRQDEALAYFSQAEAIRPGEPMIDYSRWRSLVLRDDLDGAERSAAKLMESELPTWRYHGSIQTGIVALYRGERATAWRQLETAASSPDADALLRASALNRHSEALVLLGQADKAIPLLELSQQEAPDDWPGWEAIFLEALARQAVGDEAGADEAAARFATKIPEADELSIVERRYHSHLEGRLAVARGDLATGRAKIDKAIALLPPRGIHWDWVRYPDQISVLMSAAEAAELDNDLAAALERYRRIADSGIDHHEDPIRWIRSLYHTGRLLALQGDPVRARRYLARFLSFWETGGIDRDRVEDARRILGSG